MSRKSVAARTARLEQVQQRIEHWRKTRPRRGPMPEPLWAAAVALAREHGVYATSQQLRVNYDSLRARASRREPKRAAARSCVPRFIELGGPLPLAPVSAAGPVIELSAADGRKLTLRLAGPDELDLPVLMREFWGVRV